MIVLAAMIVALLVRRRAVAVMTLRVGDSIVVARVHGHRGCGEQRAKKRGTDSLVHGGSPLVFLFRQFQGTALRLNIS
jgi:hypothetical protein